jgi:EmrB/QacA subfamily drug resistance transporter
VTSPTEQLERQVAEPRRWYALALLCAASFLVILDAQIVTVAAPSIQQDLGLTGSGLQWILSGYALAFGGLLLLGGRAADLFGRRRVFMLGVALFASSSLLCGLAWNGDVLVVSRVVQGASAALMAPAAMAIIITTFPEGKERNRALGMTGAVAAAGGSAGALAGGPLTQGLSWHWIFLVNVPIGVAMLALTPVLVRPQPPAIDDRRVDLAGALTVCGGLILLVDAVTHVPDGGWTAPRTVVPLAGAVLLLVSFVLVESRSSRPLVPLRVFRSRTLVGGNLVTMTAAVGAYGQGLLTSLYAQDVLGYTPAQFGLMTAVVPVTAVIASVLSERLVTRYGFGAVATVSMTAMAVGCALLSRLSADGGFVTDLLPGLLVLGPGLGAATVAASIAAVTGVPEHESGLASGISNTSFQVGGALGLAVLTTVAAARSGGVATPEALTAGYQAAFVVAGVVALLGAFAAAALLARGQLFRSQRQGSPERRDQ